MTYGELAARVLNKFKADFVEHRSLYAQSLHSTIGLRWWVNSADDLNLSAWAKADATQVNGGRACRSILGCNASGFVIILAIENRGLEVLTF